MKRNLLRVISLMTVLFAMLSISGCSKMELTGTLKVTVYEPTKEDVLRIACLGLEDFTSNEDVFKISFK